MIVKGREIIPPLNYFPYSFLFPLFSYYSYSSFFFLPFRTRPPHLRSPSSFPHLIFILIPLHPRSGRHPASPSNLTLPFLTPCLFLLSNLISPPYFPISPHPLTQLEDTDPPPTASSHIRTAETITGRRQIACYVSVIVQKDCVCIFELGECSIPYAATMEDGPLFESHQGR